MIDYIIVGLGLAGLSFVEELERAEASYIVYENSSQLASRVAGGLYNPVILKRFTAAWQADDQIKTALPFYKHIEYKLGTSFVSELLVLRRFNAVEEQNNWFEACDKPILNRFLSSELRHNTNTALDIPYHYGKVNDTGRVDVSKLLASYSEYLKKKQCILRESFDHNILEVTANHVEYKGIKAKNIVFTEGFGSTKNPFFNYLPLRGNKGEYIVIKSKTLQLEEAVKSSIFIIPLGEDMYKVGATYNNQDKTPDITGSARNELEEKLRRFLKVDYQIIDQVAGIRPAAKDRRPLVGTHPKYKNLHILNGLGSRGVLAGPAMAKQLYKSVELGGILDKEIDITRFEKLYNYHLDLQG